MAAYRVTRNYWASYWSRPIAFDEGVTAEVDDDVADWVNRDSPGCLVALDAPAEEATPEPATEAAPEEESDAPAEEATPKRGRRAGA
jgi:hypothetical protein